MAARGAPSVVVFRVAGGPRLGFGHVMRALALARALGVSPRISLRGEARTRARVSGLGGIPVSGSASRVLDPATMELLVLDDPSASAARPWVRLARTRGISVVSVHDLGRGAVASELAVDGSLPQPRTRWPADRVLSGPQFAMLDPSLLRRRRRLGSRRSGAPRVVVSLGGGRHALAGVDIASSIALDCPGAHVSVSPGFVAALRHWPASVSVIDPRGFKDMLARADVAVVGGGVTLYEAAALGVPAVAVAVVPDQRVTVAAFARAGIADDGGALPARGPLAPACARRIAKLVAALLSNPRRRRVMSRAGRRAIDGRGVSRVQRAIERRYAVAGAWRRGTKERQDG